jgi:hypothetical protein
VALGVLFHGGWGCWSETLQASAAEPVAPPLRSFSSYSNKVEAGDVNMDEWSGLCVPTLTVHLQWVHRRGKVPDFHLSPEALHGGLVVVGFAPEVRGGFWDVNDFIFKIAPMFVEKYVCEVLACS